LVGDGVEVERLVREKTDAFSGEAERYEGSTLTVAELPDIFMALSLFSEKRLVVIRGLSENKPVWDILPDWMPRLSSDITLVLVEAKPDKRTKTYKALQKEAEVIEHKPWGERDGAVAEQWVATEAKRQGLTLSPTLIRKLVQRVGVHQWHLYQALQKLSVFDEIDEATLNDVIEENQAESVFGLLESALKGDVRRVEELTTRLRRTDDAYQVFALLASQAVQLAALAAAPADANVAGDLGAHPFVLSKLKPYAHKLGMPGAKRILQKIDAADETMKTTSVDLWIVLEQMLFTVAA
jgi:DNA polymerase III delta subunit